MASILSDADFQERLLALLCLDRNFLKRMAPLLEADDFKPLRGEGTERWVMAQKALEFWAQYREPIGGMLKIEMLDWARQAAAGEKTKTRMLDLIQRIQKNQLRVAPDSIADRVTEFKRQQAKKRAVESLLEWQERGELTDQKWLEVCMDGLKKFGKDGIGTTDWGETLEDRIQKRRQARMFRKRPLLMIDPLDEQVQAIGRGELGVWLAYAKKGKSLAMEWVALAYILQGLNVLHITLEDPMETVEARLDAAVTEIPIHDLVSREDTVRKRFARFHRIMRSRLKLVDGTEGEITVAKVEQLWEQERNRGWTADAVIVDYDDEIRPTRKWTGDAARRMEFAEIYRDLRQLASRRQIIVWTAAQAKRQAEGKKIVAGSMIAEDISKVRKCTMVISIGVGDWGEESRYLHVAAHRTDKTGVGGNIMTDTDRGIFYVRDETLRRRAQARRQRRAVSAPESS